MTLYVRRTRRRWECCPRLWGHWTDQRLSSNQLDNVATGWLGCLRAVAAVALLVRETTKLTLGQDLFVKVPHEVNTLLRGDPHKWLSTSRITQHRDCYVRTPLSGPESGHSLSCGRRRALTGLQGNMPADLP